MKTQVILKWTERKNKISTRLSGERNVPSVKTLHNVFTRWPQGPENLPKSLNPNRQEFFYAFISPSMLSFMGQLVKAVSSRIVHCQLTQPFLPLSASSPNVPLLLSSTELSRSTEGALPHYHHSADHFDPRCEPRRYRHLLCAPLETYNQQV